MSKRQREEAVAAKVAEAEGCLLVAMRESPDAELRTSDGQTVGLEVVSLVDQEFLDSRRRIEETTVEIERRLAEAGLQRLVTIGFDLQAFGSTATNSSHRKWLQDLSLIDVIGDRPRGEIGELGLRERGIARIAWLSWQESKALRVGWGYRTRTPNGRTLADLALAKKHQKLATYKDLSGPRFVSFWLAIDSLSPGTVEDGGFSRLLARDFKTNYDKVFLMISGGGADFSEARDVTPARQ